MQRIRIIVGMMNEHDSDRSVLFRAILGETPTPTAEQIEQARRTLATDSEFQAAFDDLRRVVLATERTALADWYTRLHDYVTAQLAGTGDLAEFADVQRALDQNVDLAEEYALLYETLRAETLGALPQPHEIPPVDLSFLPRAKPASTPVHRPAPALLPAFASRLSKLLTLAHHFGRPGKLAAASTLVLVLVAGLWVFVQPERHTASTNLIGQVPTASALLIKNDPRQPEMQILHWSLQAVSPSPAHDLQPYAPCLDYVPGAMPLRGCPL